MEFDDVEGAEPSPLGLNASDLPPTVDWRKSGCVTHVKDQVSPPFNNCDHALHPSLSSTSETMWVMLVIPYNWSP